MQTFEQWWNEIEGYGFWAERFTTPGKAAKAAWDQAMSLRAQADARPVAWRCMIDPWGSCTWDYKTEDPHNSMWEALYTHPAKVGAPGLNDAEILKLAAQFTLGIGSYQFSEQRLLSFARLLTRTSAAAVAEPTFGTGEVSEEEWRTEAKRMAEKQAAQQQAEPGADERSPYSREAIAPEKCPCCGKGHAQLQFTEGLFSRLCDHCGADYASAMELWLNLISAKYFAAQSGQRAGVPEGWQLVPKIPTDEMMGATRPGDWPSEVWIKMLAAAPTQQEGGK